MQNINLVNATLLMRSSSDLCTRALLPTTLVAIMGSLPDIDFYPGKGERL